MQSVGRPTKRLIGSLSEGECRRGVNRLSEYLYHRSSESCIAASSLAGGHLDSSAELSCVVTACSGSVTLATVQYINMSLRS